MKLILFQNNCKNTKNKLKNMTGLTFTAIF